MAAPPTTPRFCSIIVLLYYILYNGCIRAVSIDRVTELSPGLRRGHRFKVLKRFSDTLVRAGQPFPGTES